jgi:hypothetical protein
MEDKAAPYAAAQTGEGWAGSPESAANAAPVETAAATDVVALNDAPVTAPSAPAPSASAPSAAWEPAGSDAEKSIEADRPSDLKPEAGRSA